LSKLLNKIVPKISENATFNIAIQENAYNRYIDNNGWYKSYIKVEDGWNESARYIEMSALNSTFIFPFVPQ
jgi:hypothetical protein